MLTAGDRIYKAHKEITTIVDKHLKEVSKKQMDKKDQLTPEEYKRVLHVITHFQLGSRVNDFRTIKAKLKRQLASLENNGWYSK